MRFVIILLGFIGQTISLQQVWQNFQINFNKVYESIEERNKRFVIFKENLSQIESHNNLHRAGNVTHKQGITQFTDWTAKEFSSYVNKYKFKRNVYNKTHEISRSNLTFPDSVDWRLEGAVSEVKNQGHCGSCWSFSATGALEGQAKIHLGKRVSLSEQNLLDCANEAYFNHGCDGGEINYAFLYVKNNGIEKELDYPYIAKQEQCRQNSAEIYATQYRLVRNTEDDLKEAVASIGPISIAIEATSDLQNYVGGVYFDRTCTDQLNHAVLAAGYGTEDGADYWLIKNSWGVSWGEQGYLKLARNRYNNCGVASSASYPVVREK